eukprot:790637-Pelagomonas_calceolata.AAC.2
MQISEVANLKTDMEPEELEEALMQVFKNLRFQTTCNYVLVTQAAHLSSLPSHPVVDHLLHVLGGLRKRIQRAARCHTLLRTALLHEHHQRKQGLELEDLFPLSARWWCRQRGKN